MLKRKLCVVNVDEHKVGIPVTVGPRLSRRHFQDPQRNR